MAAHLYLPTYKAEESGHLLWTGRPPGTDDPGDGLTGPHLLQRLPDPTERPTSSSYRTPHAVQAGAFWPIYMAAHLYLPTYKAEESGHLLWNGRPPGTNDPGDGLHGSYLLQRQLLTQAGILIHKKTIRKSLSNTRTDRHS